MTIQKGKLEAFVKVIERLAVEKGSVHEGIGVLQGVLQEFDQQERRLGGSAGISIPTFIEGLQAVGAGKNLESAIKGRSKASKLDLKHLLDAHWKTTACWPAVRFTEDAEAQPRSKRATY